MYTQASIDKVRSVDIVQLIGRFVKLDKHNSGCCPLHGEKTPSFKVNPKGFYKCFGCGAGGDAIAFIMANERKDFIESVEHIAKLFEIQLEEEGSYDKETAKRQREERKTLREVLIETHNLYVDALWNSQHGIDPMQYLTYKRAMTKDTITHWGLGFAPDVNRFLCNRYSGDEGGSFVKADKVGLVRQNDKGFYDVYRNRIIYPIKNEHGELISLAGRKMSEGDKYPKYINGYASELYDKSKTLYGLYEAIPTIKKRGYANLVEGYHDVIGMHTAGAENTIASCGTALTKEMARLLKKYTKHVVVIRDDDKAGITAAEKDVFLLMEEGFKVDVLELPDGQDPDDFSKQFISKETELNI